MNYKNGFFQLIVKEDGTYMKLFPPQNGGLAVDFDEVNRYLSLVNIKDYDVKLLHERLSICHEPTEVFLIPKAIYPENEKMQINISSDRVKVVCRFYPPSNNGKFMGEEEIISDLVHAGIKFGVDKEAIQNYLKSRKFCTDFVLAKALEPIEGKDAVITYFFNTDRAAKPKQNEDGSVDFHSLDIISHVNKGDVLAKLQPADMGRPGIDVCGNQIKPRKVERLVLKYGKNIHLSEDGLIMYSDVSGHVTLENDKVFVSDTYEVLADVDNSTGDIEYDGNVSIKGNVRTGFSVKAKGDIIVDGVVEGAFLSANGQIILKRGIQGMNRGILEAKGNVVTKFIESSTVKANGYLSTDAILHSKVFVKGDIIVKGKRGFVTGGEVHSGTLISIKTAGSPMGTNTLLEVGIDPAVSEEFRKLEKELIDLNAEKEKVEQIITTFHKKVASGEKLSSDRMAQLQMVSTNHAQLEEKIKNCSERHEALHIEMENNENGRIKIEGIAYPGVKIVISNTVYFVRTNTHHSQFVRDKADILIQGL